MGLYDRLTPGDQNNIDEQKEQVQEEEEQQDQQSAEEEFVDRYNNDTSTDSSGSDSSDNTSEATEDFLDDYGPSGDGGSGSDDPDPVNDSSDNSIDRSDNTTPEEEFVETYGSSSTKKGKEEKGNKNSQNALDDGQQSQKTSTTGNAAKLDNFFARQARDSFEEVRQASQRSRRANRQLDPNSLSPVSLTAKTAAGAESLVGETAQAATTDDRFNLQDAKSVSEQRVRELQGTIGEVAGPLTTPVETGNLIVSSTPRYLTSSLADDKDQIAPDVTAGSAVDFTKATAQQAKENPTEFLLGASIGAGLERTTTTSLRSLDADTPTGALSDAAKRADPATGIGRKPRPGEPTTTSKDIVAAKAKGTKDFVTGDLGEKTVRSSEGKVLREASADRFEYAPRERGQDTIVRAENIEARNRPDASVDPSTKELLTTEEVTRKEVLSSKSEDLVQSGKDVLTNRRKGQQQLVTRDKTRSERADTTGRRIDSQDRRQDVGDDANNVLEDAENFNQPRRSEFDRPDSDNVLDNAVIAGTGTGVIASQNQGEDNVLTPGQGQDQENPPLVENPPEEKPPVDDQKVPEGRRQPGPDSVIDDEPDINRQPEEEFIRQRKDTGRSRVFDVEDNDDDAESASGLFGGEKYTRYRGSVGAEVLDITAERAPGRSSAQNPLNLRPVIDSNAKKDGENIL